MLVVYIQVRLEAVSGVFFCCPTEPSQHRSHRNERAVFSQCLCELCMKAGCEEEDRGSVGWSRSWTPHCVTAPGCWRRAPAGSEMGVTKGLRYRGSSRSGQVRGGRRSSGAEWCWETVVELFTLPSTPINPVLPAKIDLICNPSKPKSAIRINSYSWKQNVFTCADRFCVQWCSEVGVVGGDMIHVKRKQKKEGAKDNTHAGPMTNERPNWERNTFLKKKKNLKKQQKLHEANLSCLHKKYLERYLLGFSLFKAMT